MWKPLSKKVFVVLVFGFTDHLAACFFKDLWLGEYMRWNQNRDALPGFAIAWGLCKSVLFLDGTHLRSSHVDRIIFLIGKVINLHLVEAGLIMWECCGMYLISCLPMFCFRWQDDKLYSVLL